jgi:hypothetical protein
MRLSQKVTLKLAVLCGILVMKIKGILLSSIKPMRLHLLKNRLGK